MESTVRNRVALLVVAVVALAVGIAARLYRLEIGRSDELRAQADRQHERRIEIPARRGAIVDRRGRELAVSLASSSLFAHPHRVPDAAKAASLLAPVLRTSRARILDRLRSDEPFVWLRRRLDPSVAHKVRQLDLPVGAGKPFGFEAEAKRHYPQGRLSAHVVGFTNIDQKGIEGIELAYDEILRGDPAGYLVVRDGLGGAVLHLVRPPARKPEDVVLTLDLVLQHIVERELDRAVRSTRSRWGAAILLDPTTGQILALANRPTSDPNKPGKTRASSRRNRAVTDPYEPGSTFKIVTFAAALDSGAVRPTQHFDCGNGSIVVAGKTIHDSKPRGWLSVPEILQYSSNPGTIRVAMRMRPAVFHEYIRGFGFGEKTGIELPGESRGLMTPLDNWTALSPASMAFGHEIAVTALQMASAFAIVANDGVLVPPRIVLGTRGEHGHLKPPPPPEPRRVISSRTARTLTGMLEGVVARGTGTHAALPSYRIAGKTGTGQKTLPGGGYSQTEFIASFGGFGPARDPRLAGLVVLDSPRGKEHSGGAVAAPVFRRIMAEALTYLRVPPDEDPLARIETLRLAPAAAVPTRAGVGVDTGTAAGRHPGGER